MDIWQYPTLSFNKHILDLLFGIEDLEKYEKLTSKSVRIFIPQNKLEKVLLLLLLKRTTIIFGWKTNASRSNRYINIDRLYEVTNNFVLSTVKFNQYNVLHAILETIVNYSNYNSNILLQYVFVLKKCGFYKLALEYFILLASIRNDFNIKFMIVQIYYENLNLFNEGIKWCYKILNDNPIRNDLVKAKCYLYLSIGYYWKFKNECKLKNIYKQNSKIKNEHHRDEDCRCELLMCWISNLVCDSISERGFHRNANQNDLESATDGHADNTKWKNNMESLIDKLRNEQINNTMNWLEVSKLFLQQSLVSDHNNHLTYYYLTLISAQEGNLSDAMTYIKQALRLQNEHLPSLHLLVLLESAKNLDLAEDLLNSVVKEYPENTQLYMTQAYISMSKQDFIGALNWMKEGLIMWKNLYGASDEALYFLRSNQHLYDHDNDSMKVNVSTNMSLNKDRTREARSNASRGTATDREIEDQSIKQRDKVIDSILNKNDKTGSLSQVKCYLSILTQRLRTAQISHYKLSQKSILLLDLWAMFATIYLKLGLVSNYLQCLNEMFHICDVTPVSVANKQPQNFVISDHSYKIFLSLGIYFIDNSDLLNAKFCFDNVISVRSDQIESLYYLSCIEFNLGHLDSALNRIHTCLQNNHDLRFQSKLYLLIAEIYDCLGEFEKSFICSKFALDKSHLIPVCSFDIIPLVFE